MSVLRYVQMSCRGGAVYSSTITTDVPGESEDSWWRVSGHGITIPPSTATQPRVATCLKVAQSTAPAR